MTSVVRANTSIGGLPAAVAVTNVNGGESIGVPLISVSPTGEFVGEQLSWSTATLVADTNIYADNDLLAVPQEITGVFREAGGLIILDTVVLLDGDDQQTEVELLFLNADGSLGTINGALNPSDAVADTIIGACLLNATVANATDLINSWLFTRYNCGIVMKGATTSLWVAAVVRSGTPTYTAAALKLKLGYRRQ